MSIMLNLEKLNLFLSKWPGEKYFGIYRFLPAFFLMGGVLEFLMIHWRPNGTNFYDTYKYKLAHKIAKERFMNWLDIQELLKK